MTVWRGSPAIGGSPEGGTSAENRKGPIKDWIVTLLPVAVIVAACSVGVTYVFNWVQSVSNGLSGIGRGLEQLGLAMEIGGTSADAAASVAASQPPGSLSVSELNEKLPKYAWVVGATNVPTSNVRRPIVGVNIVGTDIETAVKPAPGWCSFGLSITSSSDPLITENHLPGPGTYYQDELNSTECDADQPPTSSWTAWVGT